MGGMEERTHDRCKAACFVMAGRAIDRLSPGLLRTAATYEYEHCCTDTALVTYSASLYIGTVRVSTEFHMMTCHTWLNGWSTGATSNQYTHQGLSDVLAGCP